MPQAVTVKSLKVSPGAMFGSWGVKAVADLTHEMLVKVPDFDGTPPMGPHPVGPH